MGARVLVVEDDAEMASLLQAALSDEGHAVRTTRGERALEQTRAVRPEVVLLDWPQRAREGRELCMGLRKCGVPGLMVMSTSPTRDRLRTIFESGADDVVRKPFDLDELLLRVQALVRRWQSAAEGEDVIRIGAIEIERRQARAFGEAIPLTERELALLTHLARRRDRAVTLTELASLVWGQRAPVSNAVVAHVNHLRSKLGKAGAQLRTVRGVGYVISSRSESGSVAGGADGANGGHGANGVNGEHGVNDGHGADGGERTDEREDAIG
ncbi:response regulator transcription factor [Pendulispora albinea]|uniref:response regulator transcription factor n=1 Tax=Pendulispora albinea TaxID=2741071 RepID=UPI00374DFFAF